MKEVLLISDDHKSRESVKQLEQVCSIDICKTDKLLILSDCIEGWIQV